MGQRREWVERQQGGGRAHGRRLVTKEEGQGIIEHEIVIARPREESDCANLVLILYSIGTHEDG